MAKSHAQRQREYRERKKAEHESRWLENERKRTKAYYKKVSDLPDNEAAKRRKILRKKQAEYRARKRAEEKADKTRDNDMREPRPSTSQCTNDINSRENSMSDSKLIVKMNYQRKPNSRISNKERKRLKYLENLRTKLQRKNQNLRKSLSRIRCKMNTRINKGKPTTPKSIAENDMKEAGIAHKKNPSIRKKLIFANCVIKQMNDNISRQDRNGRSILKQILAKSILSKYRLTNYASHNLGIRHRPCNTRNKEKTHKRIYKMIEDFLKREDNSRLLPGKADALTNEKRQKVQKYVLNDYMRNIYMKFRAESPNENVSFATFCRARPKHITLVNYASRITCLCTKHQNVALKLKCLKKYGITSNTSPDSFSENISHDFYAKLHDITEEKIQFKQWKRVKCDDAKHRTKLLEIEQTRDEFVRNNIENEFEEFKGHTDRVKTQYQSFRKMKESLQKYKDHVCVQMDFAENYGIKEVEEVQSAYWNQESVTIHPVVIYYNDGNQVTHYSMVAISEVLNHNSSMVQAIIEKVISLVKRLCPEVKYINYWTDSPTSQYRNKMMFDLIAQHPILYDLQASWHYFETGHGKGACDGIGGVVKRTADTALKSGNVSITNGKDFYEWGVRSNSKIKYEYIERESYELAKNSNELFQKSIKAVKGTLKIHAVAGVSINEVMVRETTCVCDKCFTETGFQWFNGNECGWRREKLRTETEEHRVNDQSENIGVNDDTRQISSTEKNSKEAFTDNNDSNKDGDLQKGDFVAARYDGLVYIGKIVDIDDGQYEVTFMEHGSKVKNNLKWPVREDIIWIEPGDILSKVDEPMPVGKGKRFFKISEKDSNRIQILQK